MPDEGVLFEENFVDKDNVSHRVEVYEAVMPNNEYHYYCRIDDDIELSIGLDENALWIDLEEGQVTEFSRIVGNIIENKTS